MKRSTIILLGVILGLVAVPFVARAIDPPAIVEADEFNPCLEFPPVGSCVESVRWFSERARTDAELRRILNTLEWACADPPIVLVDGSEFLVLARVHCQAGNPFKGEALP